ncbi:hypothetical protein GGH13_007637 [Coemansia sp. S155-1]|nr:hypothetical protein GGH13_007637 [Coemansia sp. S155-1]
MSGASAQFVQGLSPPPLPCLLLLDVPGLHFRRHLATQAQLPGTSDVVSVVRTKARRYDRR